MKRPDQLVIRQGSILRKSPFPPEDLGPNKDGLVAKGTETKTITPIGAKRDRAVEEAGAVERGAQRSGELVEARGESRARRANFEFWCLLRTPS